MVLSQIFLLALYSLVKVFHRGHKISVDDIQYTVLLLRFMTCKRSESFDLAANVIWQIMILSLQHSQKHRLYNNSSFTSFHLQYLGSLWSLSCNLFSVQIISMISDDRGAKWWVIWLTHVVRRCSEVLNCPPGMEFSCNEWSVNEQKTTIYRSN